jgi:hypothetical protein
VIATSTGALGMAITGLVLGVAVIVGALTGVGLQATATAGIGCTITAGTERPPVTLDAEQLDNAGTLLDVAIELRLPERAAVIAVATALQESGLHSLRHGDRDSLGLFQQRPSSGWGTPEQILNPTHAATAFYRRLIEVQEWQRLPLTQAAQAVQRSAYPDAYARWEPLAARIVATLASRDCDQTAATPARWADDGSPGAIAARAALTQLGVPYAWVAVTPPGPPTASATAPPPSGSTAPGSPTTPGHKPVSDCPEPAASSGEPGNVFPQMNCTQAIWSSSPGTPRTRQPSTTSGCTSAMASWCMLPAPGTWCAPRTSKNPPTGRANTSAPFVRACLDVQAARSSV